LGVSGTGGCSLIAGQIPRFEVGQANDLELGRRTSQERTDEQELVRVLGRQRFVAGASACRAVGGS